jgi:hypothetical protein
MEKEESIPSRTTCASRTMAEAHRAPLIEFRGSNAQAQGPGWVFNGFALKRRGMKPQRVSAGFY